MLWQIVLLALVLSSSTLCEAKKKKKVIPELEFVNFDYCTLNCTDRSGKVNVHSACNAKPKKPRVEVIYPPQQWFRKTMLDEHNRYRNLLASGQELRPQPGWAGTASNMMVMNYDLEVEYIARCRAVHSYQRTPDMKDGHDTCRVRIGPKSVGQNLYGSGANDSDHQNRSVTAWYDEVRLIQAKEHFDKKPRDGGHIGHFTQLVWWSADMLGCWRVHNPINMRAWKYAVICNYGSSVHKNPGNVINEQLYKRGKPCSECPNGTKCETNQYPALCGVLKPLTTITAPQCGGAVGSFKVNLLVSTVLVLNLIY